MENMKMCTSSFNSRYARNRKSIRLYLDMYRFPKVRQRQSRHRSACRHKQQQLKRVLLSLPLQPAAAFSVSRRMQQLEAPEQTAAV